MTVKPQVSLWVVFEGKLHTVIVSEFLKSYKFANRVEAFKYTLAVRKNTMGIVRLSKLAALSAYKADLESKQTSLLSELALIEQKLTEEISEEDFVSNT